MSVIDILVLYRLLWILLLYIKQHEASLPRTKKSKKKKKTMVNLVGPEG